MLQPVERFFRAFGGRQTPYLSVTRMTTPSASRSRRDPAAPDRRTIRIARPAARRHTAGHSFPRRNGSGSSRARPEIASHPRAHRSHASERHAARVRRPQVLERVATT